MAKLTEKDYLSIARSINEDSILDDHWKYCSVMKSWVSNTGKVYKFDELSDFHLTAVIKMLFGFYSIRNSKNLLDLIYTLYLELEQRFTNKKKEDK